MVQTNISTLRSSEYTGNLKKAVDYLLTNKAQIESQEVGKYEVDPSFFYMIQEYESKDSTVWEAHKKYIDIQFVLDGEELMEVSHRSYLKQLGEYDESKDFFGFEGDALSSLIVKKGELTIFYPEDVHKPALKTKKGTMLIKKCLFKVLV